jgi:hypothetical protein
MATWTPERPQRECGPDPLAGFAAVNRSALENQGPITGGTSVTRPQNKTYSNPLNNLRRSAALTSLDFPHSSYKLKPGSRGRGPASIFLSPTTRLWPPYSCRFWVRSFVRTKLPGAPDPFGLGSFVHPRIHARGADTRVGFVFSSSRIRLDFPCELHFGFVFSIGSFSSRGCAIK